jgi:hypothetical protein
MVYQVPCAAAALRTRPLPHPTASSLVVESCFFWCIKYRMVSYHQQGCYHLYQLCAVRVLLKAEALAE